MVPQPGKIESILLLLSSCPNGSISYQPVWRSILFHVKGETKKIVIANMEYNNLREQKVKKRETVPFPTNASFSVRACMLGWARK